MLRSASLSSATVTELDLTAADLRGAIVGSLTAAILRNTILQDGSISSLNLLPGDKLVVRNYGGPSSRITVLSAAEVASDAVLELRFDADAWKSTITFQAGIAVSLNGVLKLRFADETNSTALAGTVFRVFDWTGVTPTGQFQIVSPYAVWETTQLYTTGEVTLTTVYSPLAGDANLDGRVDRADAAILATNFGREYWTLWSDGDFDGNGRIDLADLAVLQSNLGEVFVPPSPAAVPEPSSDGLALIAGAFVALRVRRRSVCLRSQACFL